MPSMVSRSSGGGRGRRTINEINMVPFIDVMLVLLIIFMVTAPLITPSVIDLPSIGKAARQPDQVIEIVIGRDDGIEWRRVGAGSSAVASAAASSTRTTLARVAQDVKGALGTGDTATAVVISADRQVKYESVVKVMDTLQRAGIQRIGLSVQLAPGGDKR